MNVKQYLGRSLAATGIAIALVAGSVNAQQPAKKFEPQVGQSGKDVIWVPTPDEMVPAMLNAAGVTSKDLVFDLGAGDGKIAIAAARQFGARAVGIEYEADMAALRSATRCVRAWARRCASFRATSLRKTSARPRW